MHLMIKKIKKNPSKKKIPWKKKANGHFDNLLKCVFYISLFSFLPKIY